MLFMAKNCSPKLFTFFYVFFVNEIHYAVALIVILITIYSPSCLGHEAAKGPFRSSSQTATCPAVYHTR